jgi:hypothetical protein
MILPIMIQRLSGLPLTAAVPRLRNAGDRLVDRGRRAVVDHIEPPLSRTHQELAAGDAEPSCILIDPTQGLVRNRDRRLRGEESDPTRPPARRWAVSRLVPNRGTQCPTEPTRSPPPETTKPPHLRGFRSDGASRARTDDLRAASATLSQLSYSPRKRGLYRARVRRGGSAARRGRAAAEPAPSPRRASASPG